MSSTDLTLGHHAVRLIGHEQSILLWSWIVVGSVKTPNSYRLLKHIYGLCPSVSETVWLYEDELCPKELSSMISWFFQVGCKKFYVVDTVHVDFNILLGCCLSQIRHFCISYAGVRWVPYLLCSNAGSYIFYSSIVSCWHSTS